MSGMTGPELIRRMKALLAVANMNLERSIPVKKDKVLKSMFALVLEGFLNQEQCTFVTKMLEDELYLGPTELEEEEENLSKVMGNLDPINQISVNSSEPKILRACQLYNGQKFSDYQEARFHIELFTKLQGIKFATFKSGAMFHTSKIGKATLKCPYHRPPPTLSPNHNDNGTCKGLVRYIGTNCPAQVKLVNDPTKKAKCWIIELELNHQGHELPTLPSADEASKLVQKAFFERIELESHFQKVNKLQESDNNKNEIFENQESNNYDNNSVARETFSSTEFDMQRIIDRIQEKLCDTCKINVNVSSASECLSPTLFVFQASDKAKTKKPSQPISRSKFKDIFRISKQCLSISKSARSIKPVPETSVPFKVFKPKETPIEDEAKSRKYNTKPSKLPGCLPVWKSSQSPINPVKFRPTKTTSKFKRRAGRPRKLSSLEKVIESHSDDILIKSNKRVIDENALLEKRAKLDIVNL